MKWETVERGWLVAALGYVAASAVLGCIVLAYALGRTVERQSRDAVACVPFTDSIYVVPRYRPTGPVPGARR